MISFICDKCGVKSRPKRGYKLPEGWGEVVEADQSLIPSHPRSYTYYKYIKRRIVCPYCFSIIKVWMEKKEKV
jgi:hypothetical protein